MTSLDATVARLPIVLVVDPVAASRLTMWRTLSRSFGVLEAPNARRAREMLAARPDIDALVVQTELPDARCGEFVTSLATARAGAASRVILVTRPADLHKVITSLTGWFFSRNPRKAQAMLREADRLVS